MPFTPRDPLIPGTEINVGGEIMTVPPLTTGQYKRLAPVRARIAAASMDDSLDDQLEVIWTALKRNYPEITKEQLDDLIDFGNLRAISTAVLALNKLQGETAAAATSGPTPTAAMANGEDKELKELTDRLNQTGTTPMRG